jgi:alkylation response protein AidB-like acyl-CoA dehydrogenase
VVDFALTPEQEMLRDTARSLFAKECPSALVRAAFYDVTDDGPADARAFVDTHLREWQGLGDGSLVDLCLFLEEGGAAVAPGPVWIGASFALPLLRAAGHPDADAIAAGELTATVAWAGRDGQVTDTGLERWFVPHVEEVDRVVFVGAGPVVACVEPSDLRVWRIEAMDLARPIFRIEVPHGALAGARPLDPARLDAATRRATVALAAEMVGVGRWIQDTTLAYVTERVQFGRPVGSFQGLQWELVDAALTQERATAAVYYAAMCVDAADADEVAAVHTAKAAAGRAAKGWSHMGVQAHGGIGYTWEHDLHLRLRRAYGDDRLLGDVDWHHERLGALLFEDLDRGPASAG